MKLIFRNVLLGLIAFACGVGLGAADFLYQKHKAGGNYTLAEYTVLQIERFDGTGGPLGVMFRRSSLVTPSLPAAPDGWEAHVWSDIPYEGLYSEAQSLARKRHLVAAAPDLSYLDGMREEEERLLDVYLDDVSRVFLAEDGGYIELIVDVPGYGVGSAGWKQFLRDQEAYYDHMNGRARYATLGRVDWIERRGPVEMAANLDLPFDLRRFHGDLGPIRLHVTARAGEAALRRFLEELDLEGLADFATSAAERQPLPTREKPIFLQPGFHLDLLAQLDRAG